ncbi:tyrosine-type recombinase/integrase [Amaricoccus solimangrovi]|nr:tyrosine-type recombinase/integrase [Amaricoccus solimangrovi]
MTGINRVRKRLASGEVREYHFAWRGKGAPLFWRSDSGIGIGSAEYVAAWKAAIPAKPMAAQGKFRELILGYLGGPEFNGLAARTRADIEASIRHPKNGIDTEFGAAPIPAFNDPRIRREVLDWRDRIGGKVGDTRVDHLQAIVGWAHDRGRLTANHLLRIKAVYKANRAEIFWTSDEIAAFEAGAPHAVARILIAATETGLRPGDLLLLERAHIHPTPKGRRIVLWTRKRGRLVSIPVTDRMGALIDATPEGRERILVNQGGEPYRHENYLGDAVSAWRDRLKMRRELRLYDARGTAATRLLEAGADLREIATAMGWSVAHASQVIERYVALHPGMTDALGAKLAAVVARA